MGESQQGARWDHTLSVGDVWRDAALSFEGMRDAVVARIKASAFYAEDMWDLEDIVVEMAAAEYVEEFDSWWDAFYDWADEHRVWVSVSPPPQSTACACGPSQHEAAPASCD